MYKLLKANFFRLKKDIIFWLFLFMTIGIAGFTLFRYSSMVSDKVLIDKIVNEFITYIGLLIAIFVSIFVGKEYSNGLIRNKIIVGHNRVHIYLSNLIVSITVGIICEVVYITIILLIGISLFGSLQMSISQFVGMLGITFLIIVAYCSIFNLITMLCSEITISTVICTLLFVAMFIAANSLVLTVHSSKYITTTYYDEQGPHIIKQELDKNYPSESKMKIAKTMYFLIPTGQAIEISNNFLIPMEQTEQNTDEKINYLSQLPMYSVALIGVVNLGGVYLFQRKELK